MHSLTLKDRARELRKQGKSLKEISSILGIAKSTASIWLRSEKNAGLYSTMTLEEWLFHIRQLSSESRRRSSAIKREQRIITARNLASKYNPTLDTKQVMLAMLYWAEGGKGEKEVVVFGNTDPLLCLLFTSLLRECYQPDPVKFRVRLHLHKYHDEAEQIKFWSQLLAIPTSQFNKTVWKKEPNSGKRYRQNYHGICFVKYNSVDLQRQITTFARAIGEHLTKALP